MFLGQMRVENQSEAGPRHTRRAPRGTGTPAQPPGQSPGHLGPQRVSGAAPLPQWGAPGQEASLERAEPQPDLLRPQGRWKTVTPEGPRSPRGHLRLQDSGLGQWEHSCTLEPRGLSVRKPFACVSELFGSLVIFRVNPVASSWNRMKSKRHVVRFPRPGLVPCPRVPESLGTRAPA